MEQHGFTNMVDVEFGEVEMRKVADVDSTAGGVGGEGFPWLNGDQQRRIDALNHYDDDKEVTELKRALQTSK